MRGMYLNALVTTRIEGSSTCITYINVTNSAPFIVSEVEAIYFGRGNMTVGGKMVNSNLNELNYINEITFNGVFIKIWHSSNFGNFLINCKE